MIITNFIINYKSFIFRCLNWVWERSHNEMKLSKISMVQNVLGRLWNTTCRDEFLINIYRGLASYLKTDFHHEFALNVFYFSISFFLSNKFDKYSDTN